MGDDLKIFASFYNCKFRPEKMFFQSHGNHVLEKEEKTVVLNN